MGGTGGDEQQDRHVLKATNEEGEKGQGRVVGPLRVVNEHKQRPVSRDIDQEPEQACRRGKTSASSSPGTQLPSSHDWREMKSLRDMVNGPLEFV
jgi:hypothetical protein